MGSMLSVVEMLEDYPICQRVLFFFFGTRILDEAGRRNLQYWQTRIKNEGIEVMRGRIRGGGHSANTYNIYPVHIITPIVDGIMTALSQPNIIILGLYGTGDARKRYVVNLVTKEVERYGVFDVIVMAGVMKKNTCWNKSGPDVRRIQEQLGNNLGLQLDDKTTLEERAVHLCDRMKMEEKILIILNGLRGKINLAKIGIPFGDDHKGSKILLVADSKEVLSNPMNTPQIEFSVNGP